MKKLSTILVALCLMWATNAVADGPVSKMFLTSPGTYGQTMAAGNMFLPGQTPANCMVVSGDCGSWDSPPINTVLGCSNTTAWTIDNCANACDQQGVQGPFPKVTHRDGEGDMLLMYQTQRSENQADGLGTVTFGDHTTWNVPAGDCIPQYTGKILKSETRMDFYFSSGDYSGYAAGPPWSDCLVDTTAGPYTTSAPAEMDWDAIVEAKLTHYDAGDGNGVVAISDDVHARMIYDGTLESLAIGAGYNTLGGDINTMRIEINRMAIGDLNGDGGVWGSDLTTLLNNYNFSIDSVCGDFWEKPPAP